MSEGVIENENENERTRERARERARAKERARERQRGRERGTEREKGRVSRMATGHKRLILKLMPQKKKRWRTGMPQNLDPPQHSV